MHRLKTNPLFTLTGELSFDFCFSDGALAGSTVSSSTAAGRFDLVTQREVAEAEGRAGLTNAKTAQQRANAEQSLSRPYAATWPAYGRVHVEPTGRLWVEDYDRAWPSPSPHGWTAFDSTGRMVGRLVLPIPAPGSYRPEVIGFGVNNILVHRSDSDGAAHFTVYPILRP